MDKRVDILADTAADWHNAPATAIDNHRPLSRPLYLHRIQAGFPSPAKDYIESTLDLNHLMVRCPSAMFYVRVAGDSMIDAGIFEGDYLGVDRSRNAINGRIVVEAVQGELTVKRFYRYGTQVELRPDNSTSIITLTRDSDWYI